MKRSAMMALWLAALALCAPAAPVRAATPSNYIAQGTLNSACATSTGCVQATSSQPGAQLCTNISTPSLITVMVGQTYTGVLTFEGTLDGQTYVAPNGGLPSSSTSTGLTYTGTVTNIGYFCVRMSSYTSGSALITISVNNGPVGVVTAPIDASTGGVATHDVGTVTVQPSGGSMTVAGSGSAGSPGGGVLTVQGTPGGTNLNVACVSGCSGSSSATAWTYFVIPASTLCVAAPCVIKNAAGTLGGLINESTTAQPAGNCTWYDSASAASGNVLYIETTIGAGQIITIPYPGMAAAVGIVVQCAATPGGNGMLALFR